MKVLVFNKKKLLIATITILLSVFLIYQIVDSTRQQSTPRVYKYTIVLDAGHGGRDAGCSGANGTKESDINLAITKSLQKYLTTLGVNVVMTRSDSNGLYSANADNFKLSDMSRRIEIIESASPQMVISIHCNSYPDKKLSGAQAFYQENEETSRNFAESVQSQLISQLETPRTEIIAGDYYILKESNLPAIIVECGYLTNPEEESKLKTIDYQNKVAYSIMCGVVKYFNLCGND